MVNSIDSKSTLIFKQALADFGGKIKAAVKQHSRGKMALDPDDIEQEVQIRLWRAIESGRIDVLTASYVQKVVVTVVIDATRRFKVRAADRLPEDETELASLDSVTTGSDQVLSRQQQMSMVLSSIDQLPVRRRLPIKLHLQGFSLQDIADLQGVTVEGARKLVSRGMIELRQRLLELGLGEFDD